MKTIKILSLIIVVALTSVSCGFIRNELGLGDKDAIRFNDVAISQKDLDADFEALAGNEQLVTLFQDSGQALVDDEGNLTEELKISWANSQISVLAIREAIKDLEIEVTDDDRKEAEDEAKNTFTSDPSTNDGEEVWEAFDEGFRNRLIESTAERIALINSAPEVTDEEAREYFDDNQAQFTTCDSGITTRHILVETQEEAQDIKSQLDDGGDFAELAKENSTDPGSKDRGGDLGCFVDGQFVAPFNEAAKSLSPGSISDPVETDFGFHVIQVQTFVVPTFEDVSDQIKEQLAPTKQQEIIDDLNERREKADIFVDEKYGKIVDQQGVPTIVPLDFEEVPAEEENNLQEMPQLTEEEMSQLQNQEEIQEIP